MTKLVFSVLDDTFPVCYKGEIKQRRFEGAAPGNTRETVSLRGLFCFSGPAGPAGQEDAARGGGTIMTTKAQTTYYNFTESAAHLLSLVSGISEKHIRKVRLEEFGGQLKNNCITLGSSPEKTRILVSPTYFDESNMSSEQYYDWWFPIYGYIKTMSHDEAPREKEAEQGSIAYRDFRNFVKNEFKTDLTTLFVDEKSEEKKIKQLDIWWNSYINQGR